MKKINTKLYCLLAFFLFLGASPNLSAQASFNASTYNGCAPLTVTFYNSSVGNGTYSWNFGDPSSGVYNTSLACSPTHTFVNAGSYTVTMTYVLGPNTYTATATITVWPRPSPVVTGNDTVCEGAYETYTASGLAGSSFYWTINGGSIVGSNTGISVLVHWTVPGTGLLTVKETSIHGCINTGKIKVLVANQPQIGNFCDLSRGTSGNPDKGEKRTCLCRWNVASVQALDINNQLMSNQIYNFQWTVLSGGSINSGGNSNIVQLNVGAGPTITVQLVAWNDFGCRDTQICIFDVCPSPKASFKADTACLTGTTHFNAGASTINALITNYTWDFGDYSTFSSNTSTTTHTYALAGVYNVKLTVKYASGCTDDTIIKVKVNNGTPPPINCPGTVCHNTKHCYNTPYFAGATYNWVITGGIGTPSVNGDSICVVWGNGPMGNISLTVVGGPYTCGYNSIDIPIFPANLQITGPDTVCQGSTVQYSVPLIPGSCYSWQPSNPNINIANNSGNIINVTIPNNVLGTFFVIADVQNDITCCHGRDTMWFVVQGSIKIDTAQATCEFSTVTYTSNVPVTWLVSGGTIGPNSPTSITITWGSAGTGVIYATAINPNLVCTNTVSVQINKVPLPPNPPINGPTVVCVGTTATFSYTNTPNIVGSTWTVSPAITHTPSGNTDIMTFTTPGTYTITTTYYNQQYNNSWQFKCYSQSQLTVLVIDTVCPTITGPTTTCIGNSVTYTIPSNPANIWQWNAIGGNITAQTPTSLTITWGNINQGQVSVQNTICPKLCTKLVTINAIPTGIITLGDSSCKGDTVRLIGPPGYAYSWSPGGATTQTLLVNTTGTYTLTLIQSGCSTSISYNINPFPKKPKPNVNISWNCMASPSLPVPYYMQATQNATWSYQWSPQTSIPSTADTTFQHYSTVFNSTHTVVVTDKNGCKDTASVTLNQNCTITDGGGASCVCTPVVTATYDPCFGQYTASITGQPYSTVLWNFSDGDYSNQTSPQHWFADTGYYNNVTLSVLCASGCWITVKVPTYVPYILRPKIRHTFPVTCNYNFIQLSYKAQSIVKGKVVTYSTDWGDGSSLGTTILPLTHNYSLPGTYYIIHQVSCLGCIKTVYDTVVIKPFNANFGFCDSGCIGQSIQFVDQSTSWSPIVHWGWTFGDATNSNLQSPFHIYNAVGSYTVRLIIQNQQGCKDTASYIVNTTTFNPPALTYTVNGVAQAGPTFSICEGGYVSALAPFSASYTYAWNDGKFGNKDTIRKSGVYWVNVTNNRGCIKKLGPFTVIVNPNPNATILSADSMCSASYFTLLALNGLGYNYSWNIMPGAFTSTTNPGAFFSVPVGNYNAFLTVTNSFGCIAKDTLKLKLLQGPVVTVTPSFTQVCEGNVVTLAGSIVGPYVSYQWSNGQVVNPIKVFSTGNYTLTATDIYGCQGSGSGYVIINPKPDLRNIPRGCYELCKNQLGVAKVCGPIPLSGQVFSYNWLLNNVTVSTNQSITLNANGNYQLIVINTVTGCADTSKVFSVTFVTGATANIGSPTPNPTICKGSGACITLTALNPQVNVLYTWWWNNSYLNTGTNALACNPGIYILHAFRSHCCEDWDTIVIDEGDCCFNTNDTNFHLIQDSTVYTTNQWWDGKYYVAGRVYVRNKAVLDMTTIDVVFDRDGEIIFEDSSIVRANNSVFRPCDMHDVWVGFTFKDSSSGFIHTNTFKNAKHAIDVKTTGPEGVKITDNTFTDCNIGVRIDRSSLSYNQGITHNSFVISNYDFTKKLLYPTYDYWGIILRSVKMEEIVSQNDFRNSDKASQPNRYFGIYALRFSASISENKFTNMYRSIDVTTNTGPLNIENNEIEKTFQGKFGSDVQIRLSNGDLPALVFANELRNSDNVYNRSTGIFAERMSNLNIRDNNIKGFDVGIWTRRLSKSIINENDIDMAGDIGILDSLSRGLDINCNIVRLKDCRKVAGAMCNSVGIFMQAGNNSNNIFTNCVFDTRRAIFLRSDGLAVSIPNVVNNYLYNYLYSGVEAQGHVGGIGFAGQPGRNTFVSNNYNNGFGARDCRATPAFSVSEMCNFGIIGNQGVTTTVCTPATMYSSTAACGQQINTQKYYAQNKWDICDNFTGKSFDIIILIDHGKEVTIDSHKLITVNLGVIGPQGLVRIAEAAIYLKNKTVFETWMGRLKAENALDNYTLDILKAKWQAMNGSMPMAISMMQGLTPSTQEQSDLKTILLADWGRGNGNKLDAGTLANLQNIDQAKGELAPIARDLVHAEIGDNDYLFGGIAAAASPGVISTSNDPYIKVVPNPATNYANVEFYINGSQNAEVSLHDVTGQKISIATLKISEGVYRLDLSSVSNGIYFVTVLDTETKEKHVAKLIKQ